MMGSFPLLQLSVPLFSYERSNLARSSRGCHLLLASPTRFCGTDAALPSARLAGSGATVKLLVEAEALGEFAKLPLATLKRLIGRR